jgi:ABC-type ATPase involved in cell division
MKNMVKVNTITRVELKDFLVFKGVFVADFCPGVNVLVGQNSTGKTTLLKVMYRLCNERTEKLSEYFFNIGNTTGFNGNEFESAKVIFDAGNDCAVIHSSRISENPLSGELFQDGTWIPIKFGEYFGKNYPIMSLPEEEKGRDELYLASQPIKTSAVFVPTAEMLSHSKGLLEMLAKYREIPFDKTQVDILVNAGLPEIKETSGLGKKITEDISDIIDGDVEYDNGVFYVVKKSGKQREFSSEASGYRKFGLLWKLLRNGLLEPGSILFWDHPEVSINPALMPNLVDALLELQRGGVQIFVATHSDLLANEFSISRKDSDALKFFSLYRNASGGIEADTDTRYDLLVPNSLIQTTVEQYEREIKKGLVSNG